VTDGEQGYLVPPGDEAALADRLSRLLAAPDDAKRMGASGRERVVAQWSLERMVDGYQDLIEAIYRAKAMRRRQNLAARTNKSAPLAPTI